MLIHTMHFMQWKIVLMIIVSKSSIGFVIEFNTEKDNFDLRYELYKLCYNAIKINNDDRKSFLLT